MTIDRVYVTGYKHDLRLTQCCVASIRTWHPDVPITLVKDLLHGDYDTSDLEAAWRVDRYEGGRSVFGCGMAKYDILLRPGRERCLILDSDIVFIGPVLDRLAQFDEDFVVNGQVETGDNVRAHYVDLARLARVDPAFRFPGWVFNAGQLVGTTGLLTAEDLAPHLAMTEAPPRVLRPDVFKCSDQGLTNYVLMKKAAAGEVTLRSNHFMLWPGVLAPGDVTLEELAGDAPRPLLLHWCGRKAGFFADTDMGHVLRYFEDRYYERAPRRRADRARLAAERLVAGRRAATPDRP